MFYLLVALSKEGWECEMGKEGKNEKKGKALEGVNTLTILFRGKP